MAVISGDNTNNDLVGTNLADSIFGFAGRDLLDGGPGVDTMLGGLGSDVYIVDSANEVVIELPNQGIDEIRSSVNVFLDNPGEAYVENVRLTGSAVHGAGNDLNNVIRGNSADNVLFGWGGNDTLLGSRGNDRLNGGAGNDLLNGGTGIDRMTGAIGNDVYVVDNTHDIVIESTIGGIDEVRNSVSFNLNVGSRIDVENLRLTGSAAINGGGNALNNHIVGNGAANVLSGAGGDDGILGGGGDDHINGGSGNDVLSGGYGKDVLNGGAGDDTINGGAYRDTITTGDGADTVIFNSLTPGEVDRITDFSPAVDTIVLYSGYFAGLATGVLDAGAFVIGPTARDAGDRIIYNDETGMLSFDVDGNGGGLSTGFCVLESRPAVTNADFIVI